MNSLLEYFKELGTTIGKRVVHEADIEQNPLKPGICLYPGAFKPPHKGHFEVAKSLAGKVGQVTGLKILISPKERQGVTAEQSLAIWKMYLKASPLPNTTVEIAQSSSPVKDIINYLESHPESTIYVPGSQSETDDMEYFEELKKEYGDRVITLPVEEKAGQISAGHIRDILRSGDYEGFKESLPDAAVQKGYAVPIFKMLSSTVAPKEEIKEVSDSGSNVVLQLEEFAKWCIKSLEIQTPPEIICIVDDTFVQEESSFGGYNPMDRSIRLVITKRNLADTMRTLAHELVHCRQDEVVGLGSEDGETGSEVENEANAVAGIIMRVYGKQHPEIYTAFLAEDTTRTTKAGGRGTLKRKMSKAGMGGKVTISKAMKFKNRKNATPHDKAQANFAINMLRSKKK